MRRRSHRSLRLAVVTLVAAAGLLPAGRAALAQPDSAARSGTPVVMSGVVRTGANAGVAGARVTLVPRAGDPAVAPVITNDSGAFRFTGVRPGRVTIQVRRLGFASTSATLDVPTADGRPALLELTPIAPQLATVVVNAARPVSGPFAQFEERRSRGFGRFITRAEIERRAPLRTSDLFRTVPGARMGRGDLATPSVRFRGSTCDPEFVLDGLVLGPAVFDIDAVAPGTIEGIEIYSGPSTVPVEFKRAGLGSRNGCGMIVVWTRRGEPRARSRRKPAAPITAAALAALVEGASVFTADQVDVAATPKGDLSALIPYPESLRGAERVTASAVVEFVVDTGGAVEGATINFVSMPAPAFAAVLRSSAPELRFTPARRSGVAVRQVVQLAVQFDPAAKPAAERSPE